MQKSRRVSNTHGGIDPLSKPQAHSLERGLAREQFDQERVARDAARLGAGTEEVYLAHVKALLQAEQLEF